MHNLQCSEGMIKHVSIHFPLKKKKKKGMCNKREVVTVKKIQNLNISFHCYKIIYQFYFHIVGEWDLDRH